MDTRDSLVKVQNNLLGPLTTQWFARFEAAKRSKERFNTIAKMCRQFFGSSAKAMWEDSFKREFFPSVQTPVFQVNLNKAFELVAVIGPNLYWKNPERQVHSYTTPDQLQILQLLGVPLDEESAQLVQAQQQQEQMTKNARNSLASLVLDYNMREQPADVKLQNELAINEMMLTGLGLMWSRTRVRPTGDVAVENVYGSVDDLLIDPDARKADWSDARWIAVKHCDPVWEVEKKFGYPSGYLAGRGTYQSKEWQGNTNSDLPEGKYADMLEWYEVWSRGGVGARVHGIDSAKAQFLDQEIGDYAYLCITSSVPHPLNVPPHMTVDGTVDDVREAFRWRTVDFGEVFECWKDDRWPVCPLSPYKVDGTPWPLAPLAPGLGHLIAMNLILISKLTIAWDQRREFIGVSADMYDSAMEAIRSDNTPAVIKLSAVLGKPINETIQYLQRPRTQDDLLQWMEYLGSEFAKATGLLDIHYGVTRTQARVSSDIDAKNRAATVRPEKIQADIVEWVRNWSTHELWLSSMYLQPGQLAPLLGQWGAMFWQHYVSSLPFDVLIKEMTCFVDAKDIQRPDNARDLDALNNLAQSFMQIATQYGMQTGDSTPINAFLERYAAAMDIKDPGFLQFGPWGGNDPQAQQMAMQQAQLEMAKTQAMIDETQAKTIGRLTDTQYKSRGVTPQQLAAIQLGEIKFQQDMQQDIEMHLQKLQQNEELFKQQLRMAAAQAKARKTGTPG